MAEFLYRVGRAAAGRARTVVAIWLALLAAAGAAFALFGGTLATTFSIPNTPTAQVTDRLAETFPEASGGNGLIVVQSADGTALTPVQRDAISARLAEAAEIDGVTSILDPFAAEAERAAQEAEVESGLAQVDAGRAEIEAARAELEAAEAELDRAREQAEQAGGIEQVRDELDAQQAEIDRGREELDAQQAQLDAQATQLDTGAALGEMTAEVRTVSADESAAIASVTFTETALDVTPETKEALMATFDEPIEGVEVDFSAEIATDIPEILGVSEVVGLIVAGVVLIVMLGTLVGAGLPLLNALLGVGVGAMTAMAFSSAVEMASITPILGIMLGLAVGIDYSLFIVNRHRRQLKAGLAVRESIALANGTSGNAVVFAGATVFIALLALNVTGIPFLGLMGTVAAGCIAIAVLVAVTMTPAMLALIGPRILSRRERAAVPAAPATGVAPRGVAATKHAAPARQMSTVNAALRVVLGIAALVVVAIPALDLRLSLPDGSSEPHDSTQYRVYSTIAEKFGEGQNGSLLVVADVPTPPSEAAALGTQVEIAETLFRQDGVVAVAPVGTSDDGSVAVFQVIPANGPTSESTEDLVYALRGLSPLNGIYELGVAGSASGNIDISETLADALPVYLTVVVGLSLIILVVVFRSVFVPVIATLGFILSFFAALGAAVAVYQWGWLADVFQVENPGPILNFLPTVLVGILFGLAMDYMLFIGSGMREAYAHGAPARLAVVQGLHAGRAVVTAAAIIMIAVFGGFVFSPSAMIRPIGFALAFGVLVDAFLVRLLIIPALMHVARDKAWWLPRWLDRLLPHVDVEGASLERRQ